MILGKGNLNYNKHCKYSFGAYVQAHDETYDKNTQHARTLDTIYLQPLGNRQNGHMVLDIATGQPITRQNRTEVPIPTTVIDRVEQLAAKDGVHYIKFKGKDINIYDADWIAGVGDNQNQNTHESDSDSDSDSSDNYYSDSDEEEGRSIDNQSNPEAPIGHEEIQELKDEPMTTNREEEIVFENDNQTDNPDEESIPEPVPPLRRSTRVRRAAE